MATYYWVGGAGTWDTATTTNWASSTGGSGGAGVPLSTDNVIIDTASGTGTITCTAGVCADLTVTATQAIILGAASSTLSVYGSLTFPATGSFSASTNANTITFASTATGKTITTNGKSVANITWNGIGGGWTLGSAITGQTFNITNGTLDTSSTGNYSISAYSMTINAGTKTLNLNASSLTFSAFVAWVVVSSGTTLNSGTSTINCSAGTPTFTGGGLVYYNVNFTSSAITTATITNANTYNNLTFTSRSSDGISYCSIDSNQTVNGTLTLGASNTAVRRLFLLSNVIGTQRTITATTVATLSDVDFRDIAFSTPQTGTRLGDCGGNSNITFPAAKTVYWAITTGVSWASTTTATWATGSSSGTANVNNIPLAQDTAIIDTKPNSGQNITMNQAWNVGTLDMSARTTALTFTWGSGTNVYGNWINGTGLTYSGTNTLNFAGRTTQQLTSAGIAFTNPIIIAGASNTVQLQDAFTTASTQTVTLTQGTLDLNNYNFTCGLFNFSNTNTRAILFGTAQIYLTGSSGTLWSALVLTGFTCTGTKIVNLTYNGTGAGRSIQNGQNGGNLADQSNVVSFNVTGGTDSISFAIGNKMMNVNLTGFAGTLTASNASSSVNIYGNLILPNTLAGITYANLTTINFFGLAGVTQQITCGGNSLPNIVLNGTATTTYQMQDALIVGSAYTLTFTTGTLDANNYNITAGLFNSTNSNTRTLNLGSGTWTITGSGIVWICGNPAGLTLNRSTSTINFSSSSAKQMSNGAGIIYYNIANTGSGTLSINQNGIFNNLSCVAGSGITFFSGSTVQTNTITFNGNATANIAITSSSTTNYTLNKIGGGQAFMNYVTIGNCTATPANNWYAFNSTSVSNNTGIIFQTTSPVIVPLLSRVSNVGVYSTNAITNAGIFDEVSNAGVSKKVFGNGMIMTSGILDETSIAGSATAMSEYPNGNVVVSGYFDEVTGGLVTNGLIAYIDASKQESYVRSGTKVFDLVNPANPATINGAVTWVANGTSNASSYWWWPSQASANYINGTIPQNYLDFTLVFQPDFTLSTSSSLTGLIGSSTDATSYDESLRMINVNGTGPWKTINPDNANGWANVTTTFYINGVGSTVTGQALATGWNIMGGYRTNQTSTLANGTFGPFNYFLGLEGYSGDQRSFRGNIAAVAFYNRQLSAGEQINNYNYFAGRFGLPYIGR